MAELINAKCPNCGAILELPAYLDRAYCMHCGSRVIIAKGEIHYHTQKTAIACPDCQGRGHFRCSKCIGDGGCHANYSYYDYTGTFKPIYCQNGQCPKCNGQGYIKKTFRKITCDVCNGRGICPTCNGSNICDTCNGSGKIVCELCNGTGFKVYEGD